jgi:hypothetical protein
MSYRFLLLCFVVFVVWLKFMLIQNPSFMSWIKMCIVVSWSCLQAVSKPVWHIPLLCVQWKTPDDGQRNCPKHVEFHSKIKTFEKMVHLVAFIIRNDNYSQYYFFILAVSKIITVLKFEIKFDKPHVIGICESLNLWLSQYSSFWSHNARLKNLGGGEGGFFTVLFFHCNIRGDIF